MKRKHFVPRRHAWWDQGDIALLRRFAATRTAPQIAAMLQRTAGAIHSACRRYDVRLKKYGERRPDCRYADATVRDVLHRYWHEQQSVRAIVAETGIPFGTVSGWIAGRNRAALYREFMRR